MYVHRSRIDGNAVNAIAVTNIELESEQNGRQFGKGIRVLGGMGGGIGVCPGFGGMKDGLPIGFTLKVGTAIEVMHDRRHIDDPGLPSPPWWLGLVGSSR